MTSTKLILVILDGLGYDTAVAEMGYMEALVQAGRASRTKIKTALPSLSRPLYETLHTGLAPVDHGILTNDVVRLSRCENIFSIARANGLTTAAAAYSWFSELYVKAPYDSVEDRELDDEAQTIQHGRFYEKDDYPDYELFADAEMLIRRHLPDFMLIHPMGCDFKGHLFGGTSPQYQNQAGRDDELLATYMEGWLEKGYEVMVTADHGMDAKGNHGGTLYEVQHVALYHVSGNPVMVNEETVDQCAIAPTILSRLGLPIPNQMETTLPVVA